MRMIIPVRLPFNPRTSVRSHKGWWRSSVELMTLAVSALKSPSVPCFSYNLVNVVEDIEIRIQLPRRQSKMESGKYRSLLVSRDEAELRLNELGASPPGNLALKFAGRRDVDGLAFALQVQEERVSPRKRMRSVR